MTSSRLYQIDPKFSEAAGASRDTVPRNANQSPAKFCGMDIGSTTCKYVLVSPGGERIAHSYARHNTRQAEKLLEFLQELEQTHDLAPGRDRLFLTGSGSGLFAPLVGGRVVQEVVAVATAVERFHPDVQFVSEIGGEDMKTIFFAGDSARRSKQVMMQSACSGGTGTFIEKTARKLGISSERLSQMNYAGRALHKISSKCGIFAEADSNTLLKAGIPVEEIIASLFEAVVYQNLATLTRGNTPMPEVLLLGGPNLFFAGLREAWTHHLMKLWEERQVSIPPGTDPCSLIRVPDDAVYYAAQGCVEFGRIEPAEVGLYLGTSKLQWWINEGQHEAKSKEGHCGLARNEAELRSFQAEYGASTTRTPWARPVTTEKIIIGCDFGSTSAKAVCLDAEKELAFSCYALSRGNPIEDAKSLFRQIQEAMPLADVASLGITGYGKDLLRDIVGADCPVVETVAHATAGVHYFSDADCICDVGGVDVKIMILNRGAVTDFRLNSQCSSGNGAFLQGVAERFEIPLSEIAERAFQARSIPQLAMGCGVFLQSDIVNQQRKGWHSEEILAALCATLPLNVWIYAAGLNNLRQAGKKFILQGGTHKNLAVVKTQVDFIKSKIPDAEVVLHPYSGEAGAIGAALIAHDWWQQGGQTQFRGFTAVEALAYTTTTSAETVCNWCPVNCRRSFVDVDLAGAEGRLWSKVPLAPGHQRVIVNNSCPKGLVEDLTEMKAVKSEMEQIRNAYPNIADLVRQEGFRRNSA